METPLVQRFRDPQPVHAGARARLESAHDLVADRAVWVLRAEGLDPVDASVVLRLRQRLMASAQLTRWPAIEIEESQDGDGVVVTLDPAAVEPWIPAFERADPGACPRAARAASA